MLVLVLVLLLFILRFLRSKQTSLEIDEQISKKCIEALVNKNILRFSAVSAPCCMLWINVLYEDTTSFVLARKVDNFYFSFSILMQICSIYCLLFWSWFLGWC